MGRLIPAGTGLGAYKRLTVDVHGDDEEDDLDDEDDLQAVEDEAPIEDDLDEPLPPEADEVEPTEAIS